MKTQLNSLIILGATALLGVCPVTAHAGDNACPVDFETTCMYNSPTTRGWWFPYSLTEYNSGCTSWTTSGNNAWKWVDLSTGYKGNIVDVCPSPNWGHMFPKEDWVMVRRFQSSACFSDVYYSDQYGSGNAVRLKRTRHSKCNRYPLSLGIKRTWWYDDDGNGEGCPLNKSYPPKYSSKKPAGDYVPATEEADCLTYILSLWSRLPPIRTPQVGF